MRDGVDESAFLHSTQRERLDLSHFEILDRRAKCSDPCGRCHRTGLRQSEASECVIQIRAIARETAM